MKKLTPQDLRVLNRLQNGQWLSTLTIMKEMFILRASARIFDLRKAGYEIESRQVAGSPYDEYRLKVFMIELPPAFPEKKAEASQQQKML